MTEADALAFEVRALLSGPARGLALEVVAQTGSTNADLLDPACSPTHPACARVALQQTAGRGRGGRRWLSDGGSLTFSLRRPLWQGPAALLGLPLVVAVAISQALEDLGVGDVAIKWPNDLLRHGRKLGGILVESSGGVVVIGIGINLDLDADLAQAIAQPAADLQSRGRPALTRGPVLAALLNRLVPALDAFQANGFGAFRAEWTARAAWIGAAVRLGDQLSGTLLGVDAQGAVRILTPHGEERGLVGDLSLRPVLPVTDGTA